MNDNATLYDLAEGEINILESDGVKVTAQDVITINYLAGRVETPEGRLLLARGFPVFVGGVTLWPMSLYASEWYERVGCNLFGNITKEYALGYAMVYSRGEGSELDCTAGSMTAAKMIKFGASLKCTISELRVAMYQIIAQDESPETPQNEDNITMTAGEFSAHLAATCGGDPDYWERRCSAGYAGSVLSAIIQQNRDDGKDSKYDERIKAEQALGLALHKIRERHLADG